MNKKLVNFIVKKYLRFDKKNPFISISAILAFLGVAIGVMVLIISMAIMNGTAKEFESKLFTMNYPLSIYPKFQNSVDKKLLQNLRNDFPNLKFSPYLSSQVILQSGENMNGGIIFGVNAEDESKINSIYKKAAQNQKLNKYDIIIGKGIEENLYVQQGDKVTLYFTSLNPTGLSMLPKMKRFTFKNSFESGLHAYDKAYVYTSIEALQTLLRKDKNTFDGIHVYSENAMNDIKKLDDYLLSYGVGIVGWWQQNGNFFAAMEMEKRALFIVLMLIILVASLNIISSLLMTVMSRRKEIALLLSMGATTKEIKSIFLKLGTIIGFSGILSGIILGFIGMWLLDTFEIISLPADVYGTSKLPLDLSTLDFVSIVIGAIIIVFLSSYYPAKKATNIDVIDVLRNE
ncbi:ABC transporter permease [Halarcobacter sp.]|uniref:ABC transporter permease n=1 Tax=Halarcobacter sp. TaxID=2321133 RepID=UPI0029F58DDC|nr:ABC transporter permease [Halarcobacter sp.]